MPSPITLLTEFKQAAMVHAKQVVPQESCGFVVIRNGKDIYVPSENIALDPENHFEISPEANLKADSLGEIVGVVHSHPFQRPEPSIHDRAACEKSQLVWWILNPTTEEWSVIEPCGEKIPLFGRPYSHGVLDCYSFAIDYYKEVYDIVLNDYPREEEWWLKGQNLYTQYFEQEGFVSIPFKDAKPGDAFLLTINSTVANHGAVYVGGNEIAHHLYGRISSRDVLNKFYRDRIVLTVRHRSMFE